MHADRVQVDGGRADGEQTAGWNSLGQAACGAAGLLGHGQAAEAEKTTAEERRGTVNRMAESVAQASYTLSHIVNMLATAHGLKVLGIDRQFSKDADGRDYSPLNRLGYSGETLYEAAGHIQAVAHTLGKAYTPTRKHPGLARARCPQQMRTALTSLRAALESVCADLAADQDVEAVTEYAPTLTFLSELEDRVCRNAPAQGGGPTADEVTAAIRANPDIARAAAAALATTTA
ncbi:hypothetical protein QQM39_42645 [Streptomyces sp. DT2A-34]|uniref:hypothetical protein n=1 Tax=Streptomyces sp. DT2A-34 TaxID=3051182 RepID=UPI00265C01E5|nr:hypothetical protein [Streptomyces sp. DT2A-34]MDO0917271.1 hypothetical protein [Streptomyces sp. DT2A-34]